MGDEVYEDDQGAPEESSADTADQSEGNTIVVTGQREVSVTDTPNTSISTNGGFCQTVPILSSGNFTAAGSFCATLQDGVYGGVGATLRTPGAGPLVSITAEYNGSAGITGSYSAGRVEAEFDAGLRIGATQINPTVSASTDGGFGVGVKVGF